MESVAFHRRSFALHGWVGIALIGVFWALNWGLDGLRTHWGFFPLWLGYCLTVDALVLMRKGSSLLTRNWRKYVGLFLLSAPVWWLFEGINWRLQNWQYQGVENFSPLEFFAWSTLNFTTVIPAVFGSAELMGSFEFVRSLKPGLRIRPDRLTTLAFFLSGLLMFGLMWAWPRLFFPFVWISLYFILEPINVWLGNHSLAHRTAQRDWRPVMALWMGVLLTALFWEMWNYFSYPKWVYEVAWGNCCHIFEMPLLGYGGYLPFALELHALFYFAARWWGSKDEDYLRLLS